MAGKKKKSIRKQDPKVVEVDGKISLRSNDGVELIVSKQEANQSLTIRHKIEFGGEKYVIPFDGDDSSKYTPILLAVEANVLSKVVDYWKRPQGRGDDDPKWHAKFIDVDTKTLCDLVLAASYLRDQGLIKLTCRTIANMIKGKSSEEIRQIFKISSDATRRKKKSDKEYANAINRMFTGLFALDPTMTQPELISIPHKSDLERTRELKLEVTALRALHIVRCQKFTGYDPKLNEFTCTRFCDYNIAFFDLDALSMPSRGPPVHDLKKPKSRRITDSSLNVISLKVVESDVGYPFSVFGTVIARDEIDYKCVYLFRRGRDNAQLINSPDDMLALTDPCRGLDSSNKIYFEIDLKIKIDGGGAKDFSRGALVFSSVCVNEETNIMTGCLCSCLSSVELTYQHVTCPLEANIAVRILEGPCNLSSIKAAVSGNFEDHFIRLYDSEAASTGPVVGTNGFLALNRHMVVVPLEEKLVIFLASDDEAEHTVLRFGHTQHSKEHYICKIGCGAVQVIVAWTAIPRKKGHKWEIIGGERLLQ